MPFPELKLTFNWNLCKLSRLWRFIAELIAHDRWPVLLLITFDWVFTAIDPVGESLVSQLIIREITGCVGPFKVPVTVPSSILCGGHSLVIYLLRYLAPFLTTCALHPYYRRFLSHCKKRFA